MPTTDNMRVVIKKANYVITYTTAWDDGKFLTVAMTSTAIAGGHARVLDLTVTSANASGNLGVQCVSFTAVIDTDIGTGEDGWLLGYAVQAHLNITSNGVVGDGWVYGVRSLLTIDAGATFEGNATCILAEVKPNLADKNVFAVGIVNNGTESAHSCLYHSGNFKYWAYFAQTGPHVSNAGDHTGFGAAGCLVLNIAGVEFYVQLYRSS